MFDGLFNKIIHEIIYIMKLNPQKCNLLIQSRTVYQLSKTKLPQYDVYLQKHNIKLENWAQNWAEK